MYAATRKRAVEWGSMRKMDLSNIFIWNWEKICGKGWKKNAWLKE